MDEPTSGLDARAAAIVMRTVRNTVDTGRTVVCTIHQPSIDIFEVFDELFLMKIGGKEIYVGPLGRHSSQSIYGVRKITKGYNPATWMLEVSSSVQEKMLGVDFADIYRNSELRRRNKALNSELGVPRSGSQDIYFEMQYSQSFITQCIACLWKQHRSYWRRICKICSMLWVRCSLLYFSLESSRLLCQPVVAVRRTVFYRERGAGMCSAFPYAFGQAVIELPYVFLDDGIWCHCFTQCFIRLDCAKFLWFIFFCFTLMYFTLWYDVRGSDSKPTHCCHCCSMFFGIWNIFAGFLIPGHHKDTYLVAVVLLRLSCCVGALWSAYCPSRRVQDKMEDSNETVQQVLENYFGFKHDSLESVQSWSLSL
ncbi:hypothetical protein Leryth_014664 [Lithospermum erythrorhizon]|nr:hypothetical protein Leryth_014664 [Lithospermum erythrorhizon]